MQVLFFPALKDEVCHALDQSGEFIKCIEYSYHPKKLFLEIEGPFDPENDQVYTITYEVNFCPFCGYEVDKC